MQNKLSLKKSLIISLNYLIGYLLVYPALIALIIKLMNASASTSNLIETIFYLVFFGFTVILAKDVLIEAYKRFISNYNELIFKTLIRFLKMFAIMAVINFTLAMIINSEANNQLEVLQMFNERPILTVFLACIFAPIVEELVFREIIFKRLYIKTNFNIAAIVSGFLFGGIHVFSSFLTGNYLDCLYIISYGAMGYIIAKAYKQEEGIHATILLHFVNNSFALLLNVIAMQYL